MVKRVLVEKFKANDQTFDTRVEASIYEKECIITEWIDDIGFGRGGNWSDSMITDAILEMPVRVAEALIALRELKE